MRKNESDKPIPYSPTVSRIDFLSKYVGPRGVVLVSGVAADPPPTDLARINVSRVDIRRITIEIVSAYDSRKSAGARAARLDAAINQARAVLGIPMPPNQRVGR